MKLLFFYAIQGEKYHQFVLPFLYFAKKYNPKAQFEILFINENVPTWLAESCRQCNLQEGTQLYRLDSQLPALSLRWLLRPQTLSDYIYIGDIDIMITEPISTFHLNQMAINQVCYSNTVRENDNTKMSGLQFVTKEWYDKTQAIRQQYLTNPELIRKESNEVILKNMILESGLPVIHESRPIHGVHISLNRKPFKENSCMDNSIDSIYQDEFYTTLKEPQFQELLNHVPTFRTTLERFITFVKQ